MAVAGSEPTSSKHRARLWRLGGLAVSLIALAVVFGSVDLAEAWDVLSHADVRLLAAVFAVIGTQLLVRGWRWSIALPPRPDGAQVAVRRTISPMLIGYLGNAILPARLGEPIRAFLVARREQIDALEAFGATVLERVVDFAMLALIGFAAALALGAESWVLLVAGAAAAGGTLVLALLVAVGFTRVTEIGVAILRRIGLAARTERLQRWTLSFASGIDRGRSIPRLLRIVALSLVAWLLDGLIFWLVAQSLGIEMSYPGAIVIGAVAVLATAIPAAPGYVGTFELAATAAAVAIGVPRAEALAMAILVHVITLVPLALAGGLALVRTGSKLNQLATEAEAVERGQG
jgi:uncharacterized protein (TIRG00374 family)